MRTVVLCAAVAALLAPRAAAAQSLTLTEAAALQRLSADSPRVRALRAGVDLARAEALAAGRWPNPSVAVNRETVGGVTEYLTTVGQVLPITGVRTLQVRAASALADAAGARADDEIRRAKADLRLAFAQLVSAQGRERELTAVRDRLRGVADVLARREAAGDAAGFDRLRAEREVIDIEADVALAAADRLRAQGVLAGFFGERVDPASLVAAPEPRTNAPLPAVEVLAERAESARGELIAFQKEVEAANWFGLAADRRRIPEPQVGGGTKSTSGLAGGLGSVVTFQATIPVFDRGRPEKAMAVARAQQAEARAGALRVTLRADIESLRPIVIDRRAAAERYRIAVASTADQIERIAQVSYEAGERGILELLDAYRTGAAARIRQSMLDLAVRQAEIELEFLTGSEIK